MCGGCGAQDAGQVLVCGGCVGVVCWMLLAPPSVAKAAATLWRAVAACTALGALPSCQQPPIHPHSRTLPTKQVSGTKFYYLRNEAALLELALVNYTMHKVRLRGV